jgi:hypothetical protein
MSTHQVLIVDCVSPHEIEGSLCTEGDILRSILANRKWDAGPPVVRIAAKEKFERLKPKVRRGVSYLHVIAHANSKEIGFIDGGASWEKAAAMFKLFVPELDEGQQRVLCLSCCRSRSAAKKLAPLLGGYFTGIFYLKKNEVDFDESITLWSMFYLKKHLDKPHRDRELRVKMINGFFNPKVRLLSFKRVPAPECAARERS